MYKIRFFRVSRNSKPEIKHLFISGSNLKNDRHFFGIVQKNADQNVKHKIF